MRFDISEQGVVAQLSQVIDTLGDFLERFTRCLLNGHILHIFGNAAVDYAAEVEVTLAQGSVAGGDAKQLLLQEVAGLLH